MVEGTRSVQSLLESRAEVHEVIVNERVDVSQLAWLPPHQNVFTVDNRQFEQLSDVQNSQGIVAVASIPNVSLIGGVSASKIVALDGLADPGNAGAILRTASWFGVEMIIAGENTVDLFSPKVVRSSMGGVWDTDIVETADLVATLVDLKETGLEVFVADMAGTDVNSWQAEARGVLVIGNEGHGVRPEVVRVADEVVSIPAMSESRSVESLNAAVSCAILLQVWLGRGQ